jgi:hypothetical protein
MPSAGPAPSSFRLGTIPPTCPCPICERRGGGSCKKLWNKAGSGTLFRSSAKRCLTPFFEKMPDPFWHKHLGQATSHPPANHANLRGVLLRLTAVRHTLVSRTEQNCADHPGLGDACE